MIFFQLEVVSNFVSHRKGENQFTVTDSKFQRDPSFGKKKEKGIFNTCAVKRQLVGNIAGIGTLQFDTTPNQLNPKHKAVRLCLLISLHF